MWWNGVLAAILLSFADPRRFAPQVRAAGVPLLCQVHDRTERSSLSTPELT